MRARLAAAWRGIWDASGTVARIFVLVCVAIGAVGWWQACAEGEAPIEMLKRKDCR